MTVTILLAARDGARFLPEQLASIAAQTAPWRLVASDDGSADATPAILRAFAAAHPGRAALGAGPRRGPAAHFLHLLARTDGDAPVAFADQDDVWLPPKLARATAALAPHGERPALWCARVLLCDEALGRRRPAPMPRATGFAHALIQNAAPGNAMVMNAAAARLLGCAARAGEPAGVPHHDWWAYGMVAGAGGPVILDDRPTVLYRQHRGNAVGSGAARAWRAPLRALSGAYAAGLRAQAAALRRSAHRLAPEARALLDRLDALPALPPARRLAEARAMGLARDGRLGDAALAALILAGRL